MIVSGCHPHRRVLVSPHHFQYAGGVQSVSGSPRTLVVVRALKMVEANQISWVWVTVGALELVVARNGSGWWTKLRFSVSVIFYTSHNSLFGI